MHFPVNMLVVISISLCDGFLHYIIYILEKWGMKVSVQLDFVKLWSYVFFNLKEMEIKIRKGGGIEN